MNQKQVVQHYIERPHLINNKKYDMRIYVAVTSFDPLRIYVYEEGLCRFATHDYKEVKGPNRHKQAKDRFCHLTNYRSVFCAHSHAHPHTHSLSCTTLSLSCTLSCAPAHIAIANSTHIQTHTALTPPPPPLLSVV
jgi:hypothetical protein